MCASEVIPELSARQLAFWRHRSLGYAEHISVLHTLAAKYDEFFIYRFHGAGVELLEKRSRVEGEGLPEIFTSRADAYLELFSRTLRAFGLELQGELGMSMQDYPCFDPSVAPIFAFQKLKGEASLLLPDIDSLWHNFYSDKFDDPFGYRDKANEAVFVGSTTDSAHTVESVRALTSPRLRSAVFFRNVEGVDFWLPNIVQCMDEAAEAEIRSLGVAFSQISFDRQFQRKFLISMDGNGATCSRVAISLKSNSVLLKYGSPHELYYFSALSPGDHFLPIAQDSDVLDILRREAREPGRFEPIAAAGTEFFREVLSTGSALAYTAGLLRGYFSLFEAPDGKLKPRAEVASAFTALGVVHVGVFGDQDVSSDWFGVPGSGHAIEGLSLNLFHDLRPLDFEFKLWPAPGNAAPWMRPGRFSGSRGKSEPAVGFSLRLLGEDANRFVCGFSCRFVDGQTAGPLPSGAKAVSDTGAALEAIRVVVSPRS